MSAISKELAVNVYQLQCWLKSEPGRSCKIEYKVRSNGINGYIVRLRWPHTTTHEHLVIGWHEELEPALSAAFKCYDAGIFVLEPVKHKLRRKT